MTSTQTTPRAHLRPPGDRGFILRALLIVVVGVTLFFGLSALMRGPTFVSRLTVDNPTSLPIEVAVSAPDSSGRLTIGSVAPGSERDFGDVVDMGDTWKIELVANGRAEVQTTVTRAELARNDWTFTVPDSLRAELVRRGGIPTLGE